MKWVRGPFQIAGSAYQGDVFGYLGFGFGIDKRDLEYGWVVTHLNSGFRIPPPNFETLREAKRAAELIYENCPRFVASRKGLFGKQIRTPMPQRAEVIRLMKQFGIAP